MDARTRQFFLKRLDHDLWFSDHQPWDVILPKYQKDHSDTFVNTCNTFWPSTPEMKQFILINDYR